MMPEANAAGIGERNVVRVAARVLVDGDEARHPATALVLGAHCVARPLGRDHDDVDVLARFDQAEMDVEPMREGKRAARPHVGLQVVRPDGGLVLIGGKHHEDVGPGRRVGVAHHPEARALGFLGTRRARPQRDCHRLDAAVAQVLCVGMALAAIAEHRDLPVGDEVQVAIGVVIDFHLVFPVCLVVIPAGAGIQMCEAALAGFPRS
jgi:hypothetical protein